jgi:hypothetical protein
MACDWHVDQQGQPLAPARAAYLASTATSVLIGGDSLPVRKFDAGAVRHVPKHWRSAPTLFAHVGDSITDIAAAMPASPRGLPYGCQTAAYRSIWPRPIASSTRSQPCRYVLGARG